MPELADLPAAFYLPCARPPSDLRDPDDLEVLMRRTSDGRTALLLYTTLERFRRCNGPDAPWVVAPVPWLNDLRQQHPYDVAYLDLVVPERERIGAPS
ncbi:SAV_915 family protein [Serinibacter salmoneus]|uniref:Type III secretion system (T3SS) SseB-like protein n=1 Tax=Serinibacter salmoneus TaxID=556530 RepID=A0A2A9D3K9_9MICO|nr:SAV_915 family protein [Serinibacter salmoneus]PFG21243.1 type III secretion system (T3SS) SseB-like protein [Serinibacter salmoneus]